MYSPSWNQVSQLNQNEHPFMVPVHNIQSSQSVPLSLWCTLVLQGCSMMCLLCTFSYCLEWNLWLVNLSCICKLLSKCTWHIWLHWAMVNVLQKTVLCMELLWTSWSDSYEHNETWRLFSPLLWHCIVWYKFIVSYLHAVSLAPAYGSKSHVSCLPDHIKHHHWF